MSSTALISVWKETEQSECSYLSKTIFRASEGFSQPMHIVMQSKETFLSDQLKLSNKNSEFMSQWETSRFMLGYSKKVINGSHAMRRKADPIYLTRQSVRYSSQNSEFHFNQTECET